MCAESVAQPDAGHFLGRFHGPAAPAGDCTGDDPEIARAARDGKGRAVADCRCAGEGRNGASTQSRPSRMSPKGATWCVPSAFVVATMVSRMSGIQDAAPPQYERVARVLEARLFILLRQIGGASPVERFVLRVALAEPPGDLRLCEFRTEIEGVRAVPLDAESGNSDIASVPTTWTSRLIDVDRRPAPFNAKVCVAARLPRRSRFRADVLAKGRRSCSARSASP